MPLFNACFFFLNLKQPLWITTDKHKFEQLLCTEKSVLNDDNQDLWYTIFYKNTICYSKIDVYIKNQNKKQ